MTRYNKNGIDERRRLISILAAMPHEGAALYVACEGAMAAIYLDAGAATRALAADVLRQQVERARSHAEHELLKDILRGGK